MTPSIRSSSRPPCSARPNRQQNTVPPSPMNEASESLMFCSPGNPESPVLGKAAGGQAVDRTRAVEVEHRVKALPQRPGGLQHGDEADRGLVGDAVHQGEVALALLGLIVGEDLGAAVDIGSLRQRGVRDLGERGLDLLGDRIVERHVGLRFSSLVGVPQLQELRLFPNGHRWNYVSVIESSQSKSARNNRGVLLASSSVKLTTLGAVLGRQVHARRLTGRLYRDLVPEGDTVYRTAAKLRDALVG